MPRRVDGVALGAMAAGALLAYAGIRGKSVPSLLTEFIQGRAPSTAASANPITQVTETTAGSAQGTVNTAPFAGPVGSSEQSWIHALLLAIGAPATTANINSIAGWIQHESSWDASPPDGALYTNNPLNTTEPGFGATGSVNSVGVKIYPSLADGLDATVTVMENGDYNDILAALRSGNGLVGSFKGLSTWSGGGYSSI